MINDDENDSRSSESSKEELTVLIPSVSNAEASNGRRSSGKLPIPAGPNSGNLAKGNAIARSPMLPGLLPVPVHVKDLAFLTIGICIGIFLGGKYAIGNSTTPLSDSRRPSNNLAPTARLKIPPLSDLLRGDDIRGNVSWMLDFSIADYPKAGTTFLMNYLRRKNDEIYMNNGELCFLNREHPSKLIKVYYEPHLKNTINEDGKRIQFGIKCPEDLETEFGLKRYAKYFPNTKLIVSVRHPVLWFESYYNFRAYHRYPLLMPHTDDLIGPSEINYPYTQWNCSKKCPSGNQNVYSDRANFHWSLSRLGKTPMSTEEELRALQHHNMSIERIKSKVFLVENRQLLMSHPSSQNFTSDLRDFLALSNLRPLKPWTPIPAQEKYSNKEAAARRIDICNDQHKKIRKVLVESGKNAADWIREYFLKSPDVVVTSRKLFIELLDDWKLDPCNEGHERRLRIDTPG